MTEKNFKMTSPAVRLLDLVNRIQRMKLNAPFATSFLEITGGYRAESSHSHIGESARRLGITIKEVGALERRLADDTPLEEALWKPRTTKLVKLFDSFIGNHQQPWSSLSKNFDDKLMESMTIWAGIVPKNEPEIDNEAIEQLRAILNDLEAIAADSSATATFRRLAAELSQKIRKALIDYQLRGGDAFSDLMLEGAVQMLKHKDDLQAAQDTESAAVIWHFWDHVKLMSDQVSPVVNAIALVEFVNLGLGHFR